MRHGRRTLGGMALHCDATLLVARPGDADSEHEHVLSDSGGWLTEKGKQQTKALAESLASRRIALVYTSSLQLAMESGEIAADLLGVPLRTAEGLEEFSVGTLAGRRHDDEELAAVFEAWVAGDLETRIPGGESGAEVLARYREALQSIADLHRGETVLVFSHGGVMSFCLPRLGRNVRSDLARLALLPNCAPAEVAVGDDGLSVLDWPGSADRAVV
jgi:broad specificity phosphatase PhoE